MGNNTIDVKIGKRRKKAKLSPRNIGYNDIGPIGKVGGGPRLVGGAGDGGCNGRGARASGGIAFTEATAATGGEGRVGGKDGGGDSCGSDSGVERSFGFKVNCIPNLRRCDINDPKALMNVKSEDFPDPTVSYEEGCDGLDREYQKKMWGRAMTFFFDSYSGINELLGGGGYWIAAKLLAIGGNAVLALHEREDVSLNIDYRDVKEREARQSWVEEQGPMEPPVGIVRSKLAI